MKIQTQPKKAAAFTTTANNPAPGASRAEAYATTQAAANGIEGELTKKDKTEGEQLGAKMTDRR